MPLLARYSLPPVKLPLALARLHTLPTFFAQDAAQTSEVCMMIVAAVASDFDLDRKATCNSMGPSTLPSNIAYEVMFPDLDTLYFDRRIGL